LAHIESCASCRKELAAYRAALEQARNAAASGEVRDWSEAEWRALMGRVTSEMAPRKAGIFGLRPEWTLASAVAAGIVLIALAVIFKDALLRDRRHGAGPGRAPVVAETPPVKPAQAQAVAPQPGGRKPEAPSSGGAEKPAAGKAKAGQGSEKAGGAEPSEKKAAPRSRTGEPILTAQAAGRGATPGSGTAITQARPATGPSQDVVSVTLVSQETGLQVVWFFDKNFEWKGDKK
jgi:hypothetical protein